ncbi:MAG: PHB depolymerase family esterase [Solirubrobacteraceae bacterium]|nr:PHB depolymerase family esterase [Solirubrobacteraceae bacterium]
MGTVRGPGGAATAPPGLTRRARRVGLAIAIAVAAGLLVAAVRAADAQAAAPTYPGTVRRLTHVAGDKTYPSIVYVPTTYDATRPTPLVVLTHGCQTTAEQQMHASLYNAVAEREGFVVLHPDVDAGAVSQPGPLRRCWRWFMPDGRRRGTGDAAAIAAMTRAAMDRWSIDPERTYMVGMSAGGFMTSIMSAAYPDLYAAVGVMSAGAYGDALCLGFDHPLTLSAATSARQARQAMGHHARVVPRIVIGGDVDGGIPLACQQKAFEQGLRTNNLVLDPLRQDAPLSLKPAETRRDAKPGGYDSTVRTYRDPDGCVVGEHWIVHGMNHFWSGGTDDPRYKGFTDPRGPNAAEATWRFFSRYTRGTTGMPCAEAP